MNFKSIYKYQLSRSSIGVLIIGFAKIIKKCSSSGLRKIEGLPIHGKIRFVPRPTDILNCHLKKVNGEFEDKFGNLWGRPKGHNPQGDKHWDVQLSKKGKKTIGQWSNSGNHVNVTDKGFIAH